MEPKHTIRSLESTPPLNQGKSWQERAKCKGWPLDNFFPSTFEDQEEAKKFCIGCDVSKQCLDFALRHDTKDGIWGGEVFGRLIRPRRTTT